MLQDYSDRTLLDVLPHTPLAADYLYYLDVPLSECMRRINKRSRREEIGAITLTYLKNLQAEYTAYLTTFKNKSADNTLLINNDDNAIGALLEFVTSM